MTSRPCRQPGCPVLLTSDLFCEAHARPAWIKVDGEANPLPPDWSSIRQRVLARDNHRCYICGDHADEVDHVENRAASKTGAADKSGGAGKQGRPENLAAICHDCHASKSGREGNRARQAIRHGR